MDPSPETGPMTCRPAFVRSRKRLGFTLIELLIVIIIIGVLIALLIPAIAAGVRAARNASVQAEINQLAQALADFKSKFGDYPPSRVLLSENGFLNTSSTGTISPIYADVTKGQLAVRSLTAFRKFWPRALFNTTNPVFKTTDTAWYDFNGNGNQDYDPTGAGYIAQGHECLVFFLGGIPQPQIDPNNPAQPTGKFLGPTGFSKNPTNPFLHPNMAGGTNRNPPLFEFVAGRLQSQGLFNGSLMPGYLDSLTNAQTNPPQSFLVYFSTNNGSGYDPNDVNFVGNPGLIPPPFAETDTLGQSFIGTTPAMSLLFNVPGLQNGTSSPSPNPYTNNLPAPTSVSYQNPQSFQIISAGADGVFGVGGIYGSTNPTASPLAAYPLSPPAPPPQLVPNGADPGERTLERDNLTNFHNGKLE
jgi:general secretion pathway protein G